MEQVEYKHTFIRFCLHAIQPSLDFPFDLRVLTVGVWSDGPASLRYIFRIEVVMGFLFRTVTLSVRADTNGGC